MGRQDCCVLLLALPLPHNRIRTSHFSTGSLSQSVHSDSVIENVEVNVF